MNGHHNPDIEFLGIDIIAPYYGSGNRGGSCWKYRRYNTDHRSGAHRVAHGYIGGVRLVLGEIEELKEALEIFSQVLKDLGDHVKK